MSLCLWKLCISSAQCYWVNIAILKGRTRMLEGQTPDTATPCQASRFVVTSSGLQWFGKLQLHICLPEPHMGCLLGWPHSVPAAFPVGTWHCLQLYFQHPEVSIPSILRSPLQCMLNVLSVMYGPLRSAVREAWLCSVLAHLSSFL